jgi:hypothetical protein
MKLRPTLLLGIWLVFPAMLGAQSHKPATIAEIATYMGGDREQVLYAGAKTESVVTWYT